MRLLALGGLFVIAMLVAVPPALARCENPNEPLQATLKFKDAPANVTFAAATPIRLVLQIENCSGDRVLTTDKFSSTDFFRRLYFTDPNGGSIINTSEETLHAFGETFFCHSRNGVLQSLTIPVAPVEVLAGPQGEPRVSRFFREFVIDPRTLYDLTLPGHYSVNARIELLTFKASFTTAVFSDCDQLPGTTVVNVGAVAGSQGFSIVSNALEFIIAGSVAAATSSITGTGPVAANGIAASTVTITLRDANGAPAPGVTPTFAASGGDSTNTIGPCSATSASGVSTCSLTSTAVGVKTLSITSPITKTGGTVSFVAECPADPSVLVTRTVDATGTNLGLHNYTKLQAAYNDATSANEVIALFGNLNENVVLGGNKTLRIMQCAPGQITAPDSSKPVVDITSTGTLTIVGAGTVGGTVGWRVGGGGHSLKNVRASGASQYGIQLLSNGNTVEGASVQKSTRHGVLVSGSGNTISGSTAQSSGQSGFNVPGGTNQLDSNTATGNTSDGFTLDGSGNTIKGSTAQSNGQRGFNVAGATNQLDANTATSNTGNGFNVSGAGNTIKGSTAQSNGKDGFYSASTGSNTRFDSNTANRNTGDGFEINGTGNTLAGNQSNTTASGGTNENSGAEYRLNVAITDGGGNKADGIGIPKTSAPQKCALFPAVGTCE